MKTATLLACCLLVLPLVGTVPSSVPRQAPKAPQFSPSKAACRARLGTLKQEAQNLFRQGRYRDAEARYRQLRDDAARFQQSDLVARGLTGMASCRFAFHQYQAARRIYLEARTLAASAGDTSLVAIVDTNLGSLYLEMGDLDAAAQSTEKGFYSVSGADRKAHLPELEIQLASLRARQNRVPEAVDLFGQAIQGADRAGDLAVYTVGWNRLGEELLKTGSTRQAEPALLEAYRVRKLHRMTLDSSYRNLGRLRLEQGDLASAASLLDRAVELSTDPRGLLPTWDIYHYRGRVRLRQGRLRAALSDLRIAVRLARAWRWSALPDEASRIGAEGWLDQVHSALIEAGNRLYSQTHNDALVRETFEAAEENRAVSLRAAWQERQAQMAELPPAYWEAIARLQRAEIAELRGGDAASRDSVQNARAELSRLETGPASGPPPLPGTLPARAAAALAPDTALLSYSLGDSASWLWALDRSGLVLYELPSRRDIEEQAQAAERAIREDTPLARIAGARLYRTLFGSLAPRFARKSRWLLSLDPALANVPIAALWDGAAPQPMFAVERHSIQIVPGAIYALQSPNRTPHTSLFVGIGDPVYNAADPRRLSPLSDAAGLALPRLVGSASELAACARSWNGESVLLTGAGASGRNLLDQLRRNPAAIHIATHVLASGVSETRTVEGRVPGAPRGPAYGLIALTLTTRNEPELLTPAEIAHWKVQAGVVVLSGCDSAEGEVLRGTGLLGLTRAWLAAGAHSVVASQWTTPDQDSGLFPVFYRELRERNGDTMQALRAAQLAMIHAEDWRARPKYWGAFFTVGIP